MDVSGGGNSLVSMPTIFGRHYWFCFAIELRLDLQRDVIHKAGLVIQLTAEEKKLIKIIQFIKKVYYIQEMNINKKNSDQRPDDFIGEKSLCMNNFIELLLSPSSRFFCSLFVLLYYARKLPECHRRLSQHTWNISFEIRQRCISFVCSALFNATFTFLPLFWVTLNFNGYLINILFEKNSHSLKDRQFSLRNFLFFWKRIS